MSSAELTDRLEELKLRRKNGELSSRDFYRELLNMTTALVQELKDENISEENIKRQIPLILVFLEEQLKKMKDRGN